MRKLFKALIILAILDLAACQFGSSAVVQEGGLEQAQVRVFFIRHGLSCGNIAPYLAELTLQDPSLTQQGMENSRQAGLKFHDYLKVNIISLDLVGSSSLMRAKQTALLMLPEEIRAQRGNLYEIGYLGEKSDLIPFSWQRSNQPEDMAIQSHKLASYVPNLEPHKINEAYANLGERSAVNYEQFRAITLPKMFADVRAKIHKARYNFAVVTHSVTMKNELRCIRNPGELFSELPRNNEVYFIDYSFQMGEKPTLIQESSCTRAVDMEQSFPGPQDKIGCDIKLAPAKP